jgi:hypothetical protein
MIIIFTVYNCTFSSSDNKPSGQLETGVAGDGIAELIPGEDRRPVISNEDLKNYD